MAVSGPVISAWQLHKGYKTKKSSYTQTGTLMYPPQFIPGDEKDIQWSSMVMDNIEYEGIRMCRFNANKLLKNYKLANAEIDPTDYVDMSGEYADLIQQAIKQGGVPKELKYYSLTDTLYNVLRNEFSVRTSDVTYGLNDTVSDNEMWDEKFNQIGQVLEQKATLKAYQKMMELGIEPDSEEGQEMINPDTIKSLPEIQQWYNTSYKNELIDWAYATHQADVLRFRMEEMERFQFSNMLITDREFWHFRMGENDYNIEPTNPVLTFYKKAPRNRYISEGLWAGFIDLYTIPEVIDNFGYLMTEDQIKSLESIYPIAGANYIREGTPNDGAMYDNSQSWEWNRQGPSLQMRQFTSAAQAMGQGGAYYGGGDIVYQALSQSEDMVFNYRTYMVRVSTMYWKTYRKVGRLIKIDELGNQIQDIVTEEYKITDKPLYNTINYQEKSAQSLIFGEHIDWTWIPEVWGGYKIGSIVPNGLGTSTNMGFSPIYLGINGGLPGRLPFQFKGDDNMYGCKLPIEGAVFNDYNVKSKSFIERLAPWQIGYNMFMNMIIDLNMDELGNILVLDQNVIPKHSLGEEWGNGNFMKAIGLARDLSLIPIDTTRANADGQAIHQQPIQILKGDQTERILAKAKLADYFKMGALQSMGFSPERVGTPIEREVTATEVSQRNSSSFAQTEQYFIDHCDHLMPRVHQMRTDLAQYYASTNPSLRMQYSTSDNAKVILEIDGTRLLLRDYGVQATTKSNMRNILNQIKQLILTNNTTDATLFDLARVIKAPTTAEVDKIMNAMEKRYQQEQQGKMQTDQQKFEMEQQQMWAMHEDKQAQDMEMLDKKLANDRYVAEVRAAAMTGTQDLNANQENDYLDSLKFIQGQQDTQNKLNFEREKFVTGTSLEREALNIRREEVNASNKRTRVMAAEDKIAAKRKEKDKKDKEKKSK